MRIHIFEKPGSEICTYTTDARWRNRLHCMAENQLPLPNVYVYSQSISYLPHLPKFSDFFDLCLHWMSVLRSPCVPRCIIPFARYGNKFSNLCALIFLNQNYRNENYNNNEQFYWKQNSEFVFGSCEHLLNRKISSVRRTSFSTS